MSKNNIQIEISVPRKTVELYLQANREIEKRLGRGPSAQVLIALVMERESTTELVEEYCEAILEAPVS